MKISSVSKKVLASALSAAMVVAFAPTVAFGAAQPVTVKIDLDGGTGAQTEYTGFEVGDTITLGSPTKNGYKLAHWWFDANGDGVDAGDSTENVGPNDPLKLTTAEVTLKAVYAAPSTAVAYSANKLTITNNGATVVAQHTYTLTVTGPTGQLAKHTFAPADTKADTKATILDTVTVDFVANPLTNANKDADNAESEAYGEWTINKDSLVAGDYTATLTDGDAVISTSKVSLVKVTTIDGDNDPVPTLVALGADGKGVFTLGGGKNWVDADGYSVSGKQVITGDVTYKTTKVAQLAEAGSYKAGRVVGFSFTDTVATGDKYAVSVVDPSGAEIYTTEITIAKANNGKKITTPITFTFDKNSTTTVRVNASEIAGDYVMTVTKTPADVAVKASSSKAKATLSQVVYDANGGTFGSAVKDSAKSYFVDGAAAITTLLNGTDADVLTAPEGKKFKEWQLNGKAYNSTTNPIKAGKVNTLTAAYVADDERIATPTATVAKVTENKTDYYVITVSDAINGAKITYTADGEDKGAYSAPIKVKTGEAADVYVFTAEYDANTTDKAYKDYGKSKELTLTLNEAAADWADYTADTTQKTFEALIGQTKDKWLSNAGIAAAIASGKAAIEAEGIYTTDAKNTAKVEVAAYKALYEAVDAAAAAELGKYADATPVAIGDKAFYIETAELAKVQKGIADNVTKTVTDAEARAAAAKANVDTTVYTKAIGNLIDKANTALKAAKKSDLTAADIAAAQTVTDALKAATTGEAAKAALEAYAALTDAQKKLVATADVAKAEAVAAEAKAAEELKNAQDDAAVSKARNTSKTVKLAKGKTKTTKKQSVALKAITSASGAKVTYKKSSGSSKVTVKSGKAYLAKGVKKGTYKATVKATCGTQTAKITVKFVVKA